jgi:aryl-alcohol dehydrogenase-like predicted oxidoreductase
MKMRFLGKTGVKVSELCFGAMTFGDRGTSVGGGEFWSALGAVDLEDAQTMVDMALDAGVNFFDTADIYRAGQAEEFLGKALNQRRKDVILATKVRFSTGSGANDVGLSRHHILKACDASLKRLGTDYIDLYQIHSFDPYTPLEETLHALDHLVRQGKVRYIGCSNLASWQIMKALCLSEKHNLEKFVTLQAYYSLVARDLEYELVPMCLDQGLGILVWSPLAGGFLTGKYRRGKAAPEGTRRNNEAASEYAPLDEEKGYNIVDELERIAEAHNATISQAALNYLLRKPGITSVIFGARTPKHLTDNLKASEWEMTPEEFTRLDEISEPLPVYPYWHLKKALQDR